MTGVYQPTEGQIRFRGRVAQRPEAQPDHQDGHRPDVPEHPALPGDDGAGERHGGRGRPPQDQRAERAAAAAAALAGGARRAGSGPRELLDVRRHQGPARTKPARNLLVRRAAAARDRPGTGHPTRRCSAWTSRPPASTRRRRTSLLQLIRRIRDTGVTVLLIEHDMRLVMGVTDRIVVLEFGKKIAEGSPAEVARQSEGDRRVPGGAGRCCLRSTTSPCSTAASRRCTASACTSTRARSSRSSARTAPARPPRCGRSPACGRWPPARIRFDGDDITKLRADLRVIRGICQSPEGRGVFPGMTVRENLEMGAYTRRDTARASRRTWSGCWSCSRGCGSGSSSPAARSPAASSRCSRSAGR